MRMNRQQQAHEKLEGPATLSHQVRSSPARHSDNFNLASAQKESHTGLSSHFSQKEILNCEGKLQAKASTQLASLSPPPSQVVGGSSFPKSLPSVPLPLPAEAGSNVQFASLEYVLANYVMTVYEK